MSGKKRWLATASHPAQLVSSLGGGDPVDGEASLHVVDDPEVLAGLVNLDDVHEAGGELGVGPGLAVDLDQTLLHDSLHLLHRDGVLQTVPELRPSVNNTDKLWTHVTNKVKTSVKVDVCFHARQIANTQKSHHS